MKKILTILFLCCSLFAYSQTPTIDTANYLTHTNTMRTDTTATNLITLNQSTHTANPMSGSVLKSYFQNGLQKQLTAGNGIQIVGNVISVVAPTINNTPGRSLNSNFTVSTTKAAIVFYSLTTTVTNPILSGNSTATVFLEYSTNSGSTWNSATQISNLSSVGITVTVQITNTQTSIVGGIVPANALVRIRTTTSGTASVTYVSGMEIVY